MGKLAKTLAALLLALGFACPAIPAADEAFLREAAQAARASERSQNLQTELPAPKQPLQMQPGQRRSSPLQINPDIARYLLYAAILAMLVIVILNLKDNLWSSSKARRLIQGEEGREAAPEATAARMEKAHLEADELARQGSFSEAMHVLLLQSVGELRRRLDLAIASSLTSREILQRVPLAPDGREAFADIISRVEISWFGPHEPGREDYQACLASFERLAAALRRGGPDPAEKSGGAL